MPGEPIDSLCRYCGAPIMLIERYGRIVPHNYDGYEHRNTCLLARREKRRRQRERYRLRRLQLGLNQAD